MLLQIKNLWYAYCSKEKQCYRLNRKGRNFCCCIEQIFRCADCDCFQFHAVKRKTGLMGVKEEKVGMVARLQILQK